MPRARNIKPGTFENEHLGALPGDIQLLFISLWTLADREGVVECRVPKIRTYTFRYRPDITDEVLNGYITVLTRLDLGKMLSRVKYQGDDYLIIHNFIKHQNPHHTEKKGSLPKLEDLKANETADNGYLTVRSPLEHGYTYADSLIPDSLIPDSVVETTNLDDGVMDEFEIFWQDFPVNGRNKGSRKDAVKKFQIARKKASFNEIMTGVNDYAYYIQQSGQSNQDAFRWLEKERWREDYACGVKTGGKAPSAHDNFTAGILLSLSEDDSQRPY